MTTVCTAALGWRAARVFIIPPTGVPTALGSAVVDMSDDSSTYSGSAWTKNTFQTDLAGGIIPLFDG